MPSEPVEYFRVVLANEAALAGCEEAEVRRRVAAVADVMENCIKRG